MQETNTHISAGWAAHRSGDNQDALRHFEAALAVDNENIDAYYGIGLAKRDLGQLNEAKAAFEQSLLLTRNKIEMAQPMNDGNAVNIPDIDRYMMLIRMIGQRLAEVKLLTQV